MFAIIDKEALADGILISKMLGGKATGNNHTFTCFSTRAGSPSITLKEKTWKNVESANKAFTFTLSLPFFPSATSRESTRANDSTSGNCPSRTAVRDFQHRFGAVRDQENTVFVLLKIIYR